MNINKSIACFLLALAGVLVSNKADSCTNIIVTKGASADGSILVSYAADSHELFGELYYHPAEDWKDGEMLAVNEWDTGRYLGNIPQASHTYQTVGNMNEHQLIIAETTFGGRPELVDKRGRMDYGSMIYIALQRCATAREAIKCMTDLANEYGYASAGETFTIADKNEVWIMEVVGKGTVLRNGRNINKGIVWVALRVPDGYICAHANQSRITTFPLKDPENCLYAEDVISFARKKGYFSGPEAEFSFADAYCPVDFETVRGCDARVWSAFNSLTEGWFRYENEAGRLVSDDAYSYLDYAMGYNLKHRMPLWVMPSRRLTVKDVADMMRDHYEGTPMDMTTDIGAGGNALPYRWRPMNFENEGKTYLNERAIATQQTGFWFVGQSRGDFPDVVGGILWFGTDDAATSYLTPIYTSVTRVPQCFKEGNGNIIEYSPTASFWINNRISNACYKMYNIMAPYVRERVDAFENAQMEKIREIDNKALDMYLRVAEKKMDKAQKKGEVYNPKTDVGSEFAPVKRFLTNYSVETAQSQFNVWSQLEETLLVKYIDGNVKAQNQDGTFKHSDFTTKLPRELTQPGYTEVWKAAVAREHGQVVEVPKEEKAE